MPFPIFLWILFRRMIAQRDRPTDRKQTDELTDKQTDTCTKTIVPHPGILNSRNWKPRVSSLYVYLLNAISTRTNHVSSQKIQQMFSEYILLDFTCYFLFVYSIGIVRSGKSAKRCLSTNRILVIYQNFSHWKYCLATSLWNCSSQWR